jgi:hypothetical protein
MCLEISWCPAIIHGNIETLSHSKLMAAFLFNVYTEKEGLRTLVATMKSVSYRTGKPIDPEFLATLEAK